LKMYGEDILFSHIPIKDIGYTMNIHGHLHNSEHRSTEKGIQSIRNDKQVLIAMEYTDYKPLTLLKMVEDFQRKNKRIIDGKTE
jgi:calcineurin-like phosphoesterase family protein